ncbi:MAG: sigma-70 family RNA polymerase sigma factor, partial [Caldilineaceae bacterium]|nr:sigma-70 family RNA polymerase sigma factor [Caldilineaceae bacterium]
DEIRGNLGRDRQAAAYLALANYLYKVAYNYLLKRQSDIPLLATLVGTELTAFAQDSVQEILFKISADNHQLLNQYAARGKFLSWMALILRNQMAGLLRRPPYSREVPPPTTLAEHAAIEISPLTHLTLEEIGRELEACLDDLSPDRRVAIVRCILHGERTKAVAPDLGRTVNATDQLVLHAKRRLKNCLLSKGIGPEVLQLFE